MNLGTLTRDTLASCNFAILSLKTFISICLLKEMLIHTSKKKKLIINSFLLFIWILDLHFSLVCMNVLALACYFSNSFEN